jgi:hypothetical protein
LPTIQADPEDAGDPEDLEDLGRHGNRLHGPVQEVREKPDAFPVGRGL